VLDNVAAHAARAGLDPAPYVQLWRGLIEWSIAREEEILGKGR
jgi:isochorismate pyruvate lyase